MAVRSTSLSLLVVIAWLFAVTGPVSASLYQKDSIPTLAVVVGIDGSYNITVEGEVWLASLPSLVCFYGHRVPLSLVSVQPKKGNDDNPFGAWSGYQVVWLARDSARGDQTAQIVHTFKQYSFSPSVVVLQALFPQGLDLMCPGSNTEQATDFPAFSVSAARAASLGFLSWRSTALSDTQVSVGLGNLPRGDLDCGPVVAFELPQQKDVSIGMTAQENARMSGEDRDHHQQSHQGHGGAGGDPKPTGLSLMWSTATSHKIVVQTTTAGAQPLVSLWSEERKDHIACLSNVCFNDQKAEGNYARQRVEGYGFQGSDSAIFLGEKEYKTVPLRFAWSVENVDNWVGTNSSPPDSTYTFIEADGMILQSQAPLTIPLRVYSKRYNTTHTDFASVASQEGISWAVSNGYSFQYIAGYVFESRPSAVGKYSMGLSAAIKSIPQAWSYSVLFSASRGGPTKAVYEWGALMQSYYKTYRLPSVTLSDIGYYTDDGAYYYVWEAFNIPQREWPAEKGLVLVKERLWKQGVPIAYMQLDDCE